jgi:hypothetical protein
LLAAGDLGGAHDFAPRTHAIHLFTDRFGQSMRARLVCDLGGPLAVKPTRLALLLGSSPIRHLEAELRLELTAPKAGHKRGAVTNRIVNLLHGHAARELVQDLLSVVVVQSSNLLLERLSLRL